MIERASEYVYKNVIELFYLFFLVAVVVFVLLGITRGYKSPQNIYESAYNACIARETIDSDRCHDMALREAYGD